MGGAGGLRERSSDSVLPGRSPAKWAELELGGAKLCRLRPLRPRAPSPPLPSKRFAEDCDFLILANVVGAGLREA